MPRCLSMTDTKIDLSVLDVGDFERVVEGEHNGQQVVLTALHKVRHEDVSVFPIFFPFATLMRLVRICSEKIFVGKPSRGDRSYTVLSTLY